MQLINGSLRLTNADFALINGRINAGESVKEAFENEAITFDKIEIKNIVAFEIHTDTMPEYIDLLIKIIDLFFKFYWEVQQE